MSEPQAGGHSGEAEGLVNVYVCQTCGGRTVTKNRDSGTTPFMISCRKRKGCKGAAYSSFYRVDQSLTPDLLFIKPTAAELEACLVRFADRGPYVRENILEHVRKGGLLDIDAKTQKPGGEF